MKILLCINCKDVQRLRKTRTTCECGQSSANLIQWDDKDNHVAAIGPVLIMGVDDADLQKLIALKAEYPKVSNRVPMFLLPEPCKSVHRMEELQPAAPKRRRAREARA